MNISTLIWTNSSIKALFLKKKSVVMNRRNKYILHKITCLWQNGNKIWNQAAPVWLDLGCNVSPALLYHLIKITPIVCLPGWWKSVVVGSHCLKFVDLSLSLPLSQLLYWAAAGGWPRTESASQPATKYSNPAINWDNLPGLGSSSGLRAGSGQYIDNWTIFGFGRALVGHCTLYSLFLITFIQYLKYTSIIFFVIYIFNKISVNLKN